MPVDEFDAMLDEAAGSKPESAKPASVQRPLVLVIDDDPSLRRSLEVLLSTRYRVILCSSAAEGVAAFNNEVCAVVLDVKMRDRDGFWASDEIRKIEPDVPILFYSAYQDAKDPFDIINMHRPFGYVTKDGDPKRLLDMLETAARLFQSTLRTRRTLEELKRRR